MRFHFWSQPFPGEWKEGFLWGRCSKLYTMPEEIRVKIQKTLQKIINEGSANIITILL